MSIYELPDGFESMESLPSSNERVNVLYASGEIKPHSTSFLYLESNPYIKSIQFGIGGYQDAMLGLHVTLGGDGWGVGNSYCFWDAETIERSEHAKWTEAERDAFYALTMRRLSKLLKDAKVSHVEQLKGVPVEVTFVNRTLTEWRILTEVL